METERGTDSAGSSFDEDRSALRLGGGEPDPISAGVGGEPSAAGGPA